MRSFEDASGRRWQAALLDASYGNVLVVFSPLSGGEVLQCPSGAENLADAEARLLALDEVALRVLLANATAWGAH